MNDANWITILTNVVTWIAIIGFFFFLKKYLPSYFEQKGKNLATKEDIEEITTSTERARCLQEAKEEKVRLLTKYLNKYSKLIELYRLMARSESHMEENEEGEKIWIETSLEPDPSMLKALEDIESKSLIDAINKTVLEIRLDSGSMSDIMHEIDPSDILRKKFSDLFISSRIDAEYSIQHKDFEGLVKTLFKASNLRREITLELQDYRGS